MHWKQFFFEFRILMESDNDFISIASSSSSSSSVSEDDQSINNNVVPIESSETSGSGSLSTSTKLRKLNISQAIDNEWAFSPRSSRIDENFPQLQSSSHDNAKLWCFKTKQQRDYALVALALALVLVVLLCLIPVSPLPVILFSIGLVVLALMYYTYRRLYFDLIAPTPTNSNSKRWKRQLPGVLIVLIFWTCLILAFVLGNVDALISEEKSVLVLFLWFIGLGYGYVLLSLAGTELIHLIAWLTMKYAIRDQKLMVNYKSRKLSIARIKAGVGLISGEFYDCCVKT
jgi:hypothetical protein